MISSSESPSIKVVRTVDIQRRHVLRFSSAVESQEAGQEKREAVKGFITVDGVKGVFTRVPIIGYARLTRGTAKTAAWQDMNQWPC